MAETSEKMHDDPFKDHLTVTHPDGRSEKIPLPEDEETIIKVGRELDNDVVLVDPRASRYHAELRRSADGLEIKDLKSANGVLIDEVKIEPDTWVKLPARQTVQLAETRLTWQKATTSQSTVVMSRQRRDDTKVSAVPPPTPPAASPAAVPPTAVVPPHDDKPTTSTLPWALGLGAIVAVLVIIGIASVFFVDNAGDGTGAETTAQASQAGTSAGATDGDGRSVEGNLSQQVTSIEPTQTPTPSGPQLAIPVVELTSIQVSPIIFGASPSTTDAYIFIDVRVRNAGNIPFIFSISNFHLQDRSGNEYAEAGANTSENYLMQLGAIDRFEGLALTPGGSVPGSLVFQLETDTYDLELVFDPPDVSPVVLGLGTINMRRELDLAAGTPLAALQTGTPESTTAPTAAPTPTATRPAEIPSPVVVPRSALRGTIAYPVFNGETYDLYFGDVGSTETRFFRSQASQPAFNIDGSAIAFHSWDNNNRGLMTMAVSGAQPRLVANFIEDQLPTWTVDSENIVFLTRRSGDRKSNLRMVDANTERSEGTVLGEGEYPTIGRNGQLVFKGWGNTAFGLRLSTPTLNDIETVTNVEEDTAPALSPDGSQVVFMSRREDNWDVYMINVDGSNLRRLTEDRAEDGLPTWSPDGNAIAFVSNRGGPWAVWVMTAEGQGISQLFTMPGTPDGFVGGDNFASRGWAEERISWTNQRLVEAE